MPYHQGNRLPGEHASKLGHLEVLNSPLVNRLVTSFRQTGTWNPTASLNWQSFPQNNDPLDIIFAVDGSLQIIEDENPPHKALAFVKTALMRLDQVALGKIDKENPHPYALRDLMAESALYHATVFPLRHVLLPGLNVYDAVRETIYESLKDASLNGEPMETLKWIVYEKWSGKTKNLPGFQCPNCAYEAATLAYDSEVGLCNNCHKKIFISDMLGFHLEMVEDAARDSIASAYMNIHETLLLFTGIRFFWETNRDTLKRCLFIKDGPLQIRAQYSKLVAPIRRFLIHAFNESVPICVIGQEKTGIFVDHLDLIAPKGLNKQIFIPDHKYICEQIQQRPASGDPYGIYTNYGAKVFLCLDDRYKLTISIPPSVPMEKFILKPELDSLIGLNRIIATLPNLLSSRFENALLPVELANSIASLSTYPSAQILKIFANKSIK